MPFWNPIKLQSFTKILALCSTRFHSSCLQASLFALWVKMARVKIRNQKELLRALFFCFIRVIDLPQPDEDREQPH